MDALIDYFVLFIPTNAVFDELNSLFKRSDGSIDALRMKVFFSDVIENSLDELHAFKSIFVGFDRNNSNLGLLPTEKKHSLFLQLRAFQIHLNVCI